MNRIDSNPYSIDKKRVALIAMTSGDASSANPCQIDMLSYR